MQGILRRVLWVAYGFIRGLYGFGSFYSSIVKGKLYI